MRWMPSFNYKPRRETNMNLLDLFGKVGRSVKAAIDTVDGTDPVQLQTAKAKVDECMADMDVVQGLIATATALDSKHGV